MPYFVAAFLAAGAMAWYFFLFVPAKLEYFVGLRLRTLAVASSQVKSKAENLARAFKNVPLANADAYLRVLIPNIQLYQKVPPPGLHLTASVPTPARSTTAPPASSKTLKAAVAWEEVVAQASEVSARDFDDLILALPSGEVVWQREKTTPRIGNLTEVLNAEIDGGSWFSLSWSIRTALPKVDTSKALPTAVALKLVKLGVQSSLLIVQAVKLVPDGIEREDKTKDGPMLYVAGVVSRTALQRQAMRVPLAWVVLLSLPVILLFLALPFVKLATLTPKERYSFSDVVLLVVATIAGAGLGASIPFIPILVNPADDSALRRFADDIEAGMARDAREVLALAQTVQAKALTLQLHSCAVTLPDFSGRRCDLWAALGRAQVPIASLELDVVIWLDELGRQTNKWTTKAQVTGRAPHKEFQHFRDLMAGRTWKLAPRGTTTYPAFTIEPLRAPTTAELGVMFALDVPGKAPGAPGRAPNATDRDSRRFLALNVRPHSLLDPVVPPGYGFAVLAPDGKVLFHSEESLSLEENFFQEAGDPGNIRDKAQSGRIVTWSGDYHGRPHRLHMQPVTQFQDCPWRIVTFQELDRPLAMVVQHQSGTFRLALVNLAVLGVVALVFLVYSTIKQRDVRDLIVFSPTVDARWVVAQAVLAVIGAAAVSATYMAGAHRRLDLLYAFFLVLPLLALLVAVLARRKHGDPATRSAQTVGHRAFLASELGLLVMVAAALPGAGFARIVARVQDDKGNQQWLETTQQRIAERNRRMLARVSGPNYPVETRKILTKTAGGFADAEGVSNYSYLEFLPRHRIDRITGDGPAPPDAGQHFVRSVLGWSPLPSREEAGERQVRSLPDRLRLEPPIAGPPAPALKVCYQGCDPPPARSATTSLADLSVPRGELLGVLILATTIAAVYWSRGRLAATSTVVPDLKVALASIGPDGDQGVLLIGPPRTQKDQLVTAAVRETMGVTPAKRIRLLDADITSDFIDARVREVRDLLLTPEDQVVDSMKRLWILVSNLETQLVDASKRRFALQLLEKLLDKLPGEPSRVVVVTSSIDPVAHFEEIFGEERKGIYNDVIPEVQLSRTSLLLSRFRRCYLPIPAKAHDPWWDYDPSKWRTVLAWEVDGFEPLAQISTELSCAWRHNRSVSLDDLARAVTARALAVYQLLWSSCTRREKLVLIQLAQEGFVTCQSGDVVAALVAKGLIVKRPVPAVFNYTFRAFLRSIERNDVVQEWERMDGNGLWVVAGRLIGSSLIAGGLFYLLTQDYSVDGLLPILSGTGLFGVPLFRNLFARISGKMIGGTATV